MELPDFLKRENVKPVDPVTEEFMSLREKYEEIHNGHCMGNETALINDFVEKDGYNIPKLSIWRHYGNKKRHIPTEVNKPHAQRDDKGYYRNQTFREIISFVYYFQKLPQVAGGVEDDHIIAIELDIFENEKYRDPRTLLEYTKS